MERSRLYKNQNKDSEELRRRRIDQSVELRKAKKDEQLQKRRNILLGELDETVPLKEKQNTTPEKVNYDSVIRDMRHSDPTVRFTATQLCRKTLSKAKNPPIDEFYKRGAVQILVESLSFKSDPLIFEAAWALTNIASGDSSHTASVVNSGAVPKLISLLDHPAVNVAEQCVWALGNIAGDGAKFRDMLIDKGVVEPVLRLIERAWSMPTVVSNTAWMLSNLCRNRDPPPARGVITRILPMLERLLQYSESKEVVMDTAWALSYASDSVNEFIDDILSTECVPHLLRLLSSNMPNLISPALRTIGNLVIGNDIQTQKVLDFGLLSYIPALLLNDKSSVVKETCWVVSNITAGNVDQVQSVIDHNIIPYVLEILHKGEFRTQKEACWVISNMVNGGSPNQCAYLLNHHVLPALCNLLTVSEVRTIVMVLEAIRKLFEVSDEYGQLEPACIELETCGGLDKLEQLQDHNNEQIYQAAYDLIERYFNDGDDETNECAPTEENADETANMRAENNQEFHFIAPEPSDGTTDFRF